MRMLAQLLGGGGSRGPGDGEGGIALEYLQPRQQLQVVMNCLMGSFPTVLKCPNMVSLLLFVCLFLSLCVCVCCQCVVTCLCLSFELCLPICVRCLHSPLLMALRFALAHRTEFRPCTSQAYSCIALSWVLAHRIRLCISHWS